MFFYITIALITTFFVFVANKSKDNRVLWLGIAIIIPSVIGGFRDETIGTDMDTYGILYYEWTTAYSSIMDFFIKWPTKEYGYGLLCYIGSWFGDIHAYLFLSEFIKMLLVISTSWYFRKYVNPCIVVFVYMLFAYWYGLSLMRQSLALCCCFYSLRYFWNRQYISFVLWIFIGYMFHNSAIFFLYLPLLTYIYNKTKYPLLISTIGIFVMYSAALSGFLLLASTGMFKEEMVELYLDSGVPTAKVNMLISLFMLAVPFLFSKYEKKGIKVDVYREISKKARLYGRISSNKNTIDKKYWFFIVKVSSGMSLVFLFLSSYFEIAFRVSFYMMYVMFIAFPIVLSCIQKKTMRNILNLLYLMLIVVYFVINVKHGLADTIPYSSKILGI